MARRGVSLAVLALLCLVSITGMLFSRRAPLFVAGNSCAGPTQLVTQAAAPDLSAKPLVDETSELNRAMNILSNCQYAVGPNVTAFESAENVCLDFLGSLPNTTQCFVALLSVGASGLGSRLSQQLTLFSHAMANSCPFLPDWTVNPDTQKAGLHGMAQSSGWDNSYTLKPSPCVLNRVPGAQWEIDVSKRGIKLLRAKELHKEVFARDGKCTFCHPPAHIFATAAALPRWQGSLWWFSVMAHYFLRPSTHIDWLVLAVRDAIIAKHSGSRSGMIMAIQIRQTDKGKDMGGLLSPERYIAEVVDLNRALEAENLAVFTTLLIATDDVVGVSARLAQFQDQFAIVMTDTAIKEQLAARFFDPASYAPDNSLYAFVELHLLGLFDGIIFTSSSQYSMMAYYLYHGYRVLGQPENAVATPPMTHWVAMDSVRSVFDWHWDVIYCPRRVAAHNGSYIHGTDELVTDLYSNIEMKNLINSGSCGIRISTSTFRAAKKM